MINLNKKLKYTYKVRGRTFPLKTIGLKNADPQYLAVEAAIDFHKNHGGVEGVIIEPLLRGESLGKFEIELEYGAENEVICYRSHEQL